VHLLTVTPQSTHCLRPILSVGIRLNTQTHVHTPVCIHTEHTHTDLWVLYYHVMFHYRWGGLDLSKGDTYSEKDNRQTGRDGCLSYTHSETIWHELTHNHTRACPVHKHGDRQSDAHMHAHICYWRLWFVVAVEWLTYVVNL